jgi:hypothetical protein
VEQEHRHPANHAAVSRQSIDKRMTTARRSATMGDARYERVLDRIEEDGSRALALHELDSEALIQALAATSRRHDPLLANTIATEFLNRYRRLLPLRQALILGLVAGGLVVFATSLVMALYPTDFPDAWMLAPQLVGLVVTVVVAMVAYRWLRERILSRMAA